MSETMTRTKEGLGVAACSHPSWEFVGHMSGGGYALGMVNGWSITKYRCGLAEKEILIRIGKRRRTKSVGYFHRDHEKEYKSEETLAAAYPGIFANTHADISPLDPDS